MQGLWGDLLGPSCPRNSHASCTALSLIAFLCVNCCLCAALCGCVGETKHHGVAAFVCSVAGAQREGGTLQVVDGVIAISWQRVWIVSMKAAVVAALVLSSSCCATASCHSGWGDRRCACTCQSRTWGPCLFKHFPVATGSWAGCRKCLHALHVFQAVNVSQAVHLSECQCLMVVCVCVVLP